MEKGHKTPRWRPMIVLILFTKPSEGPLLHSKVSVARIVCSSCLSPSANVCKAGRSLCAKVSSHSANADGILAPALCQKVLPFCATSFAVHAQGIYPSQNKVGALPSNPNTVFHGEAKSARHALGRERDHSSAL